MTHEQARPHLAKGQGKKDLGRTLGRDEEPIGQHVDLAVQERGNGPAEIQEHPADGGHAHGVEHGLGDLRRLARDLAVACAIRIRRFARIADPQCAAGPDRSRRVSALPDIEQAPQACRGHKEGNGHIAQNSSHGLSRLPVPQRDRRRPDRRHGHSPFSERTPPDGTRGSGTPLHGVSKKKTLVAFSLHPCASNGNESSISPSLFQKAHGQASSHVL